MVGVIVTAFTELSNPRYTRRNRKDSDLQPRRRRQVRYPDMPAGLFAYDGNGNYSAIIEGATHGFMLKAYTPAKCWRIFYIAPDGLQVEQSQRLPFDMAAVAIHTLLAETAYSLTLGDDRAEAKGSSPPPSAGCPDDVPIPW